jgi:hypothetical protein
MIHISAHFFAYREGRKKKSQRCEIILVSLRHEWDQNKHISVIYNVKLDPFNRFFYTIIV